MKTKLHQILHFIRHFFTAKRKGHGVHSPFAYQLCEEVFYNQDAFYDFDELKKVRNQLLINPQKIQVEDLGAGSKTFKTSERKIKHIADRGVTLTAHSELFYKLINYLNCTTTIELGTSIGLNTLYLAQANKSGTVFTLEGSKNLSDFAKQLAEKNQIKNIQYITGNFDQTLPALLDTGLIPDLVYIDGNHTYDATLRYFQLVLKTAQPSTVIIFDDIYWSAGMTKAWEEIKTHPSVTLSIDTFYFGIIFLRPEIKEKTHLKLLI